MEFKFKEALNFYKSGQLNKSKEICLGILKNQPKHFDSIRLLSIISYLNKNYLEASKLINKAIKINSNQALAYYDQGTIFHQLEKFDLALKSYNKAIKINSKYSRAYYNRGNTLRELKRYESAIESFKKAIEINPNDFEAHNNCGNLFFELGKYNMALQSFDRAIKINPDYSDGYYNLANTLYELGQLKNSIDNYNKAIKINPSLDFLLGKIIYVKSRICDWKFIDHDKNILKKKILEKGIGTQPMTTLSLYDSPSLQRINAENFVHEKFSLSRRFGPIKKRKSAKKIRIGYYSADFYNHVMSYLLVHLFESHDKSRFEIFGFSFSPEKNDKIGQRIFNTFDKIINIKSKSDNEIVKISRDLNIDIAIDLMSFTLNNRFGIFVKKCAPIQINFLGYPGTSGSKCIDYILADKILIPEKFKKYYSEKIIYMPDSYKLDHPNRKVSDKIFTREELNLPKNGFVFCSFNKTYKITPNVFDIWMKILKQVKGSVLWLLEDNPTATNNLKLEANKRNIDSARIIFAKRTKMSDHLARHKVADLFIDTLPYNAHTTASDGLWVGLPFLTLVGDTFASRVGASMLKAIGLPELITYSENEYKNKAIEIATNPVLLKKIKKKLEKNKLSKPLFDAKLFTKNVESAYTKIYKNYIKNKNLQNIEIN